MKKTLITGVICIFLSTVTPLASGEDSETTYIFTNEDLGKYTRSDRETRPSPDTEETIQTKTQHSLDEPFSPEERLFPSEDPAISKARAHYAEEQNKRMWCARGTSQRRSVERAESDFKAAKEYYDRIEEDFSVVRISSCKLNAAKSRMESAKHRLERARKELADLENEAHSQWVPPGWVRCQFDY